MGLLHGPTPVDVAIERAQKLLRSAGDNRLLEANVLAALAELKAMQTSFDDARELLMAAHRTYEILGLRLALAGVMQVAGTIELLAGDAAAAEQVFRQGYDILVGITGWQGPYGLRLADALYRQQRYAEATELVDAVEGQTLSGELEDRVFWATVKGPLLARAGQVSAAEEILRDALDVVAATDALNLHALVLSSLAEVQQLSGADAAAQTQRRAISLFTRKGNIAAADRVTALLTAPIQ